MYRSIYLLALRGNDSRTLELSSLRREWYVRFGFASALALDPLIPLAFSLEPFEKNPFLPFTASPGADPPSREPTRTRVEAEGNTEASKGRACPLPALEFLPPQKVKKSFHPLLSTSLSDIRGPSSYFYPLHTAEPWRAFRSIIDETEAITVPFPLFTGLFIAVDESTFPSSGQFDNSDKPYPLQEGASSPHRRIPNPWKSYKLLHYEVQWRKNEEGTWWKDCTWKVEWELSLRSIPFENS